MNRLNLRWVVLAVVAVILLLWLTGCGGEGNSTGTTQRQEAAFSEANQARLFTAQPPPPLQYSLERENLIERTLRFNQPGKVSYIYLLDYGQVIAFYPVQGKVSALDSQLTSPEQIVDDPYGSMSSGVGGQVLQSPQEDGSYGTNGDGIFFFTTENVYVEWNGEYILMDAPMQISSQPLFVYDPDSQERIEGASEQLDTDTVVPTSVPVTPSLELTPTPEE